MTRDRGIDFLMFIAVLLVVNSHLEAMYVGSYKVLATGGVIGDALFFFCSGYKLFLGRLDGLGSWYKRRISRIYPTVVVWDVLASMIFSIPLTLRMLLDGNWFCGYWFVKCIMVHYLVFYFIRKYFSEHLWGVLFGVVVGVLVWWGIGYVQSSQKFAMAMLGASKFEWFYMFIFTLLGAMLGRNPERVVGLGSALGVLFCSLVGHYGYLLMVNRFPVLMPIRIMVLVPLCGVVLGGYMVSRTAAVRWLMESRGGVIFSFLGGLSLEVYISHPYFQTSRFNPFFPFNIVGFFGVAFGGAYLLKCCTNFIGQAFNRGRDFCFKEIFLK